MKIAYRNCIAALFVAMACAGCDPYTAFAIQTVVYVQARRDAHRVPILTPSDCVQTVDGTNTPSNAYYKPKSDAEAVERIRLAADHGCAAAQVSLGDMYSGGRGVHKSNVEAVKWYRQAANQGFSAGQYALGVMYRNGYGVPRNLIEADKWYILAAAQGDGLSNEHREVIEKKMKPEQIAEAQKLAAEWRPKQ